MRHTSLFRGPRFHLIAAATLFLAAAPTAGGSTATPSLDDANLAWDRGDYPAALRGFLALLDSPQADALLEPIALQTGELYHTLELTDDGDHPAFSTDGRYLSYEIGRGVTRQTRVAPAASPADVTVTLPGYAAAFSPDSARVAYIRVAVTPAMRELQQTAETATGAERAQLLLRLAQLTDNAARIVVHDLATAAEKDLGPPRPGTTALFFGVNDTLLFTGADEDGVHQVYRLSGTGSPVALTAGVPGKVLHAIDRAGTIALFIERGQQELARFGVIALPDGRMAMADGFAPALSQDGRTVASIQRRGERFQLVVASPSMPGEATVLRAGREPLDAPALSHDGSLVVFQMMPREDWELYVLKRDGSGERRITREIQHDVAPRFLSASRVLGLIGEPRHRRSYLYDLDTGRRTRLFHNNTVRTIAPEYRWAPDSEGTALLVVAERDGDTVSPERGVYLMDLARTISREELRARLVANLAAEETLRATTTRLFAPIAEAVRQAVGEVSVSRIFGYQQALFELDSKHISQPGNRSAAAYLYETYRSFGYEPAYQWFAHRRAYGGETANVLATLEGTVNPELVYVVSSHYDSVEDGPGADDNSSGTAALLETARILAGRPQPATIVFASFTGEEAGLLGSREFVQRAVAGRRRIVGALNNDMIGWANDHRLDNTIRYSNEGMRDVQHGAAIQFTRLITYDARYYKNTDAHAYYEAYGDIVAGIGSYPILGNPHYHEPHDVLETISHELVAEVAKTTAATIMLLASSPSRLTGLKLDGYAEGVARLSWTPGPERGITGYLVRWQASGTERFEERRVAIPRITLNTPAGTVVSVKAVNQQGLEGWDWAHVVVR